MLRLDIVLKAVLRYKRDAYKWELRNSDVQALFRVIYRTDGGTAYAHEPGESLGSSLYKGCLAWICSRETLALATASRPYVSLQIVWPLGSCALITLPSSDNAKFKLDPKPDIPNLAQASSDHAGLRPSSRSCVVLTHSEETAGMQCAHLAAARGLGCKGAGRACSFDRTKS